VGITQYIANVPDGTYAVSLFFAELESLNEKEISPYSLGNVAIKVPVTERIFSIKINDQMALSNFNIFKSYGSDRAVEKKFIVRAEKGNGIRIDFLPVKGKPVLNGLRIARKF
jgi:beta-galactosidase